MNTKPLTNRTNQLFRVVVVALLLLILGLVIDLKIGSTMTNKAAPVVIEEA